MRINQLGHQGRHAVHVLLCNECQVGNNRLGVKRELGKLTTVHALKRGGVRHRRRAFRCRHTSSVRAYGWSRSRKRGGGSGVSWSTIRIVCIAVLLRTIRRGVGVRIRIHGTIYTRNSLWCTDLFKITTRRAPAASLAHGTLSSRRPSAKREGCRARLHKETTWKFHVVYT